MSADNKIRLAHELLDEVNAREDLTPRQVGVLRSFLPELPKQKTLAEVAIEVYRAWYDTVGSDWDKESYGDLDAWLHELHTHLVEIEDTPAAAPAHPEILQTGAEYQEAPWGTIVATENSGIAWIKKNNGWSNTDGDGRADSQFLWGVPRKVLRWGESA